MDKNIKSKGSIIKYEPLYKRFSIISGELFHFNNETHQFELDLNPYGDAEPIPLLDLKYQNNKLTFRVVLNSEIINYSIFSKYKSDQIIYQMMIDLNNNFIFEPNENDKFSIEFDKSILKTIELTRYSGIDIKKSLRIIFRDEGAFVIKYPFEKLILQSINITNYSIICKTAQEVIEWETTDQKLIFNYIHDIIRTGIQNIE